MNLISWMALVIGTASFSAQVLADTSANRSTSPRHQLIACMTKQLSTSKTISYNEATKVCKAQLKPQSPTLASGTVINPASGVSQ